MTESHTHIEPECQHHNYDPVESYCKDCGVFV